MTNINRYQNKNTLVTKQNIIPVCLATDNNYAIPCAVTITSILSNDPNQIFYFYILDGGISTENIKKISMYINGTKNSKITFIKINDKEFDNFYLPTNGHFNKVNYFRLKIPTLIPSYNKIIYLDSDVIVKKKLSELYNIDISDYHLAAAKAQTSARNKFRLGLPKNTDYYNSGVLLINSKKWREDKIENKLIDYISKSPPERLINVDQDAINSVLYKTIKPLKQNWNTEFRTDISSNKKYQKIIKNPYIIHYVAGDKPWLLNTKQNKYEYQKYLNLFNENLDKIINKFDLPPIDIILATYNRKDKISTAIDSIVKQTYQNWKLYIINDGGEDISEIVKKFNDKRIELINIKHAGKAEAVNYGLKISKNSYISYMDDDDIIFPNHLETLIKAAILNNKNFVYTDTFLTKINEDSQKIISQEIENELDVTYEMLRYKNYINHKQILHSRELYKKAGTYDKRLSILIDWDYIKRLAKIEEPYHVKIITGNHFLYYKNKEINSISGLWTKSPEKVGESLNIIFSKDSMAMIDLFTRYHEYSDKLLQISALQSENQNLSKQIEEVNKVVSEYQSENQNLTKQIKEVNKIVSEYQSENKNLTKQIEEVNQNISNLQTNLNTITSSKYYKIWRFYCKIKDAIK